MVIIKFYSLDHSDFWSLLSWVAHILRTRRLPAFTHVGFVIDDTEYFLSCKGVYQSKPYKKGHSLLPTYTHFNTTLVLNTVRTYSALRVKITWLDALKFLFGAKVYANTCVTFTMLCLGYVPQNVTVDDFFTIAYACEQNNKEAHLRKKTVLPPALPDNSE